MEGSSNLFKKNDGRAVSSNAGRKRRRGRLLPDDFLFDIFVWLSVEEIIDEEKSLNTVSRLVYRIATRNHRALKALWQKPARNLPDIRIEMNPSKSTPTFRIEEAIKMKYRIEEDCWSCIEVKGAKKVLPTMSPLKDGIIGIGDVIVLFENVNDTPEYRSLLEVLFYLLDKLLKY
jgi:hypothetical protein